MSFLEHHDSHVSLYVSLRQQVRWEHGIPVCYDCGEARTVGRTHPAMSGTFQVPEPLWTAFDANGTPRRVCRACYGLAYHVA